MKWRRYLWGPVCCVGLMCGSVTISAAPIAQTLWLMDGSGSFTNSYTSIMSEMAGFESALAETFDGFSIINGVEHADSKDAFNRVQRFIDPGTSEPTPRPWGQSFGSAGPLYSLEDIILQSPDVLVLSIVGDDGQQMSDFDYANFFLPALDSFVLNTRLFINVIRYSDGDPRTNNTDARYDELVTRYGGERLNLADFDMPSYTTIVANQILSVHSVPESTACMFLIVGLISLGAIRGWIKNYFL